jgi:protein ImuA
MRLIACHNGKLHTLSQLELQSPGSRTFCTGLPAIDGLLPHHRLSRAAVHEVLFEPVEPQPLLFSLLLAMAGCRFQISDFKFQISNSKESRSIILSDPHRQFYPPALAAMGLPLERLLLLHPQTPADETWAVTECLRCSGVGAVVASPQRLSKIETRRLQLAAEQGGGVGILLRPQGRASAHHAAATRWLIRPVPGERTIQRWSIELIHGHGGRLGQAVTLEYCRETHSVRASEAVADRPSAAEVARIPA